MLFFLILLATPFILIFGLIGAVAVRRLTLPRKKIDHGSGRIQAITSYRNGQTMEETWSLNGRYHRDGDLPARIQYYRSGQVKEAEWYLNGQKHRVGDQPAEMEYYESGQVKEAEWHLNGRPYRENGQPTEIEYYENGRIKEIER